MVVGFAAIFACVSVVNARKAVPGCTSRYASVVPFVVNRLHEAAKNELAFEIG